MPEGENFDDLDPVELERRRRHTNTTKIIITATELGSATKIRDRGEQIDGYFGQ